MLLLVALLPLAQGLGSVRQLQDDSDFSNVVNGQFHVLVEFYEPECAQCEKIESEFAATARALEFEDDIILARVDTKESPKLKKRFGISGHPVYKWFAKGAIEASNFFYVHYHGRMANTFLKMIGERVGREYPQLEMIVSKAKKIDAESLEATALGTKPCLVAMYTPWNEDKDSADALDDVANLFDGTAIVAKFPIERARERDLAKEYGCVKYPCYYFFDRANEKHEFHDKKLSSSALSKFLNSHLGTDRDPLELDERAMVGRVRALDKILKRRRTTSALEAAQVSPNDQESKDYYVKISKKIDNNPVNSDEYLKTEKQRLDALREKPGISVAKRREFAKRANILDAFIDAATKQRQKSRDSVREEL